MEENHKAPLKKHIFICTQCSNDDHCCESTYASELLKELKVRVKEELGGQDTRVNASGCLGVCEEGIHAVVYPTNKWFKKLSKDSIDDLISYLKSDT